MVDPASLKEMPIKLRIAAMIIAALTQRIGSVREDAFSAQDFRDISKFSLDLAADLIMAYNASL